MSIPKAYWSVSLDAECPECKIDFDVLDLPDSGDIVRGTEACSSNDELHVHCPECGHEFLAETAY